MVNDNIQQFSRRLNGDIDFIHYWKVIRKYWRSIMSIVIIASICAVFISLILPKRYKSAALIIPVTADTGGGGLGALASQFSGIAALAGISFSGGGDSEEFMAILKSRTLTENIINQQNLLPVLFPDKYKANGELKASVKMGENGFNMERAVIRLKKSMTITEDRKEKTIKISGVFLNPEISARVVNAYIEELQKFINENAFTVAKRNRIFIEQQLQDNEKKYLEAGKEINAFYKAKGVSSTEADLDVDVGMNFEADTENISQEMPKFAALDDGKNPALSNLIAEKVQLEKKISDANVVKDVPQQVYLSYLLMRRALLAKITTMLTSQYEMAKIEETKEELDFQVIDWAVTAIERDSPRRAKICISVFLVSLIFSIFLAFFREYIKKYLASYHQT